MLRTSTGSLNRSSSDATAPDAPELTELTNRLDSALTNLFRVLRHTGRTYHSYRELTVPQLSILETLLNFGPMSITELAARERVRCPTTTVAVTRLERGGRVKRTVNGPDRRWVTVSITSRGRVEHREALDNLYSALARMLGPLDDDERLAIRQALTPLARMSDGVNVPWDGGDQAEGDPPSNGPESVYNAPQQPRPR
jgi:DNA-binding MarR family transcriptional regulator